LATVNQEAVFFHIFLDDRLASFYTHLPEWICEPTSSRQRYLQQEYIVQEEIRSQGKKRLHHLLKAAVGGLVFAAATLVTPAADASPTPTAPPTLTDRVQEMRKQLGATGHVGSPAEEMLASFNNWGNHWHDWHDWHNWGNWHNHW
jgi:hypothetical protein